MRPFALCGVAVLGVTLGCAAWEGPPPPPLDPGPAPFSGELAFAQLEKLVALGPRVAGTPAAAETRALVRAELEGLGLEVHEDAFHYAATPESPSLALANLWVEVPGTRPAPGLFLVATPLDTAGGAAGVGANEGGSGVALLLELARTLRDRPLAYAVRLLFLDGELFDGRAGHLGSEHAYYLLREAGELERLRLVLYLHQVADRELEIRRDRRSDRTLRDLFFAAAERGGFADAFPFDTGFDALRLGHLVFSAQRFPHVIALADIRFGPGDPPGAFWRTAEDELANCAPESLGAVGFVVRAGLEAAAERQQTVDRATGAAQPPEDGHP